MHIWCIDARTAASLGGSAGGAALDGSGSAGSSAGSLGGVRLGALSEGRPEAPRMGACSGQRRAAPGGGSALALFNAFAANSSLSRPTGMGSAPADCS